MRIYRNSFPIYTEGFLAILILVLLSSPAVADVALSLDPVLSGGTPVANSNHGWQFTANIPITVTHLGLFDDNCDGFDISHPIGLWRLSDHTLLASGTMSQGTGDLLLGDFRYIDIPDVTLNINTDYVIGYHSAMGSGDFVITNATNLQVNTAITLHNARWSYGSFLDIPSNTTTEDRIGPNFQFTPEPATMILLGLGGLALLKRRHNVKS